MTRFGLAMGGRRETLAGLSGLGDLVLTCSSTSSHCFSLGKAVGEGKDVAGLLKDRRTVAEGAYTAPVLDRIAKERDIDMPVVDAVAATSPESSGSASSGNDAQPAAGRRRGLEVDRDALLFPVAVTSGIGLTFLACRFADIDRSRLGHGRRFRQIGRGLDLLWPFHAVANDV